MKASEARAIADEKNGVHRETSLLKILTDITIEAKKGGTQLCLNKGITQEVWNKLLDLGYAIEEEEINNCPKITFITW